MEKLHKDKINTVIGVCEKKLTGFFAAIEARYSKTEASQIKYFLLQNTVFAGGVFRSTFTDMPVKDIDVFFTSLDASIEFLDRFMKPSPKKALFEERDITKHSTFNWHGNSRKEPPLSFITKGPALPIDLINEFDFTFNQHYFDLNSYTMCFDVDAFNKIGRYNPMCQTWHDKLRVFKRALRFMEDGFKIDSASLIELVGQLSDKEPDMEDLTTDGYEGLPLTTKVLPLTLKRYTETDYFGIVNTPVVASSTTQPANRYPDWYIYQDFNTGDLHMQLPNGNVRAGRTLQELQQYRREYETYYTGFGQTNPYPQGMTVANQGLVEHATTVQPAPQAAQRNYTFTGGATGGWAAQPTPTITRPRG